MYSGVATGGRSGPPRAETMRGGKNKGDKDASGISRLLGAENLQSAPGVYNPRYAAEPM